MPSLVTFLSDYGLGDPFVGLCRAALLAVCPGVEVIDLSHAVAPQDVGHGAARLADAVRFVDQPAVHLAVVDPGVGTGRRAIVVAAGGDLFVGPDNGLLLEAVDVVGGPSRAWSIEEPSLLRAQVSATFHGRDLFAPVAGRLAGGLEPEEVGPEIDPDSLVRLRRPGPSQSLGYLDVPIRDIDRFGNCQLACQPSALEEVAITPGTPVALHARGVEWGARRVATFADLAPGEVGLLEDAFGWIAVVLGNADAALRLGVGLHEPITIEGHVEVDLDTSD